MMQKMKGDNCSMMLLSDWGPGSKKSLPPQEGIDLQQEDRQKTCVGQIQAKTHAGEDPFLSSGLSMLGFLSGK